MQMNELERSGEDKQGKGCKARRERRGGTCEEVNRAGRDGIGSELNYGMETRVKLGGCPPLWFPPGVRNRTTRIRNGRIFPHRSRPPLSLQAFLLPFLYTSPPPPSRLPTIYAPTANKRVITTEGRMRTAPLGFSSDSRSFHLQTTRSSSAITWRKEHDYTFLRLER